jgi:hypothetical protein
MNEQTEGPHGSRSTTMLPHIGAFVLETLTLDMYGEPRHTLREYVQNSYDAIRAAQRTRFLKGRAVVRFVTARRESTTLTQSSSACSLSPLVMICPLPLTPKQGGRMAL